MHYTIFFVSYAFRPVLPVQYLVNYPNGCTNKELSLVDDDDCLVYSFHVSAPSRSSAIEIGKLLLTDVVRDDYHHDALPRILSVSCLQYD